MDVKCSWMRISWNFSFRKSLWSHRPRIQKSPVRIVWSAWVSSSSTASVTHQSPSCSVSAPINTRHLRFRSSLCACWQNNSRVWVRRSKCYNRTLSNSWYSLSPAHLTRRDWMCRTSATRSSCSSTICWGRINSCYWSKLSSTHNNVMN